jgi:hypothetical protein
MAYLRIVRIVRTKRYKNDLKRMKVSDDDRDAFEEAVAAHPTTGTLFPASRVSGRYGSHLAGAGRKAAVGLFTS